MINLNSLSSLAGASLAGTTLPTAAGGLSGLGNIQQLFSGLSQALQALADLLGELSPGTRPGTRPGQASTPAAAPFAQNGPSISPLHDLLGGATRTADGASGAPIAGKARIWGDPHFIGADGDTFDVQGKAGKIYNLLSDQNFQLNGQFEAWGKDGATVIGKAAINADGNFITVDKKGETFVNGLALKDGQKVDLFGGGTAEKHGDTVTVKKGEWEVAFQSNGDYLNLDIKTDNAIADGVRPQGLIGQTFDGDGKALHGDAGAGAQGGGAIKDAHGKLTQAGDKDAVQSYEVDSLFSSIFKNHNASGFADLLAERTSRSAGTALDEAAQRTMGNYAMQGFFSLMSSLQSLSSQPTRS